MKLSGYDLFPYTLPLKKPLPLKSGTLTSRSGCLLRLQGQDGKTGWGEAFPLPGFHVETTGTVEAELESLKELFLSTVFPDTTDVLWLEMERLFQGKAISASSRFCLEMALWSFLRRQESRIPDNPSGISEMATVPVAGLLIGGEETILQESERLLQAGFRSLKMKVGRGNMKEEIQTILALKSRLKSFQASLRLDANRSWSFDEAVRFCRAVGTESIEFIEEPLQDASPETLLQFRDAVKIPLAFDESAEAVLQKNEAFLTSKDYVVLKPGFSGGVSQTYQQIEVARSCGAQVVLSAAFPSALTLCFLVQLAASWGLAGMALGVGTFEWFEGDFLGKPFPVRQGSVAVMDAVETSIRMALNEKRASLL